MKDKTNFYNIAQGSLEELRCYLILSRDLGYLKEDVDTMSKLDTAGHAPWVDSIDHDALTLSPYAVCRLLLTSLG